MTEEAEWLSLIDALAIFCEAWEETPIAGPVHPSGRHNGVSVRLVGGLSAVWSGLQAQCWCRQVECRARRDDPTAPLETLPAKALHHFQIVDLIGEVITRPTGERFYEPMFRRARRVQQVAKPDSIPPVDWQAEWFPLKKAAAEMRVHSDTMKRWCKQHGIGRRICGRWQVDRRRLECLQNNVPFPQD